MMKKRKGIMIKIKYRSIKLREMKKKITVRFGCD